MDTLYELYDCSTKQVVFEGTKEECQEWQKNYPESDAILLAKWKMRFAHL